MVAQAYNTAAQEVDTGGSWLKASQGKKVSKTQSEKYVRCGCTQM
jgi:hypothetical protein